MLEGKTVVLGVTGSIAAYKIAGLASSLKKLHADVHVIMTKNAVNFINPITFETLTGNKCLVDTFDRNFQFHVAHVSLAQKADLMLVAPASANIIAKMAHGIADDMLSTTLLAASCPILVSPAMNTHMYENPVTQDNLRTLVSYGKIIIEPGVGYLACGDTGAGRMPDEDVLLAYILKEIKTAEERDLEGMKLLVTAGPTREAIDPVRYITNHSTGKMGYAIAKAAMLRGADVTLVSGPTALKPPMFVNFVPVVCAEDMYREVTERAAKQDIIIKAAAVADYRPAQVSNEKIKKQDGNLEIPLERTKDILKTLGENRREGQIICGFSMETENVIENSQKKLYKKNVDMIAANSLREDGAGFGTDTNHLMLITKDGVSDLPKLSKEEEANLLLSAIVKLRETYE